MAKYKHGVSSSTTSSTSPAAASVAMAQCVIGTAPVHRLDDYSKAVNTPVLCESIDDCKALIGYSTDFSKYTLCQSMYINFIRFGVAPVVFINVLDPATHKKSGTQTITITDKTGRLTGEVIPDSLVLKNGAETLTKGTDYLTAWVDDVLTIYFTDGGIETVTAEYDEIDPSKVTASDILGKVDSSTGARTGAECIRQIYPKLGVVPFLHTAPGWSHNDTVGAMLAEKTVSINGCFTAKAILDLEADHTTTDAVIAAKKERTTNDNCIICYPSVKVGGYTVAYSALLSALIMYQASQTGGVTCSSPSNVCIDIDDAVTNTTDKDGVSVYYDAEDGNELNAEGIVTIISRSGFYTWGNNMACYPAVTDTERRWIVASLTFAYNDNDFITSNTEYVDGNIDRKTIDNMLTRQNIKLAGWTASGYILGGEMYFNESENTDEEILKGHVKFTTKLATNIPMEYIENETEFDIDIMTSALVGGAE